MMLLAHCKIGELKAETEMNGFKVTYSNVKVRLDVIGYLPESLIIKAFLVLRRSPKVPFEYDAF